MNILQIFTPSASKVEVTYVTFRMYRRLCLQWATMANAPLVYNAVTILAQTISAQMFMRVRDCPP